MRETNHRLVQQNRILSAATRELQQQVTDMAPTPEAAAALDQNVQSAMHETGASSLEVKLQGELDQSRREGEELRHNLASEKERHVANAEQFRRDVMNLQQETEDLKVGCLCASSIACDHTPSVCLPSGPFLCCRAVFVLCRPVPLVCV